MLFDWTIHFSDVVLVGAGILAFIKMYIGQDRINNRLLQIIGDKDKGLVHDTEDNDHRITNLELWRSSNPLKHSR